MPEGRVKQGIVLDMVDTVDTVDTVDGHGGQSRADVVVCLSLACPGTVVQRAW